VRNGNGVFGGWISLYELPGTAGLGILGRYSTVFVSPGPPMPDISINGFKYINRKK
jgi:hypothetical protein